MKHFNVNISHCNRCDKIFFFFGEANGGAMRLEGFANATVAESRQNNNYSNTAAKTSRTLTGETLLKLSRLSNHLGEQCAVGL
jgi:hypothetical protein